MTSQKTPQKTNPITQKKYPLFPQVFPAVFLTFFPVPKYTNFFSNNQIKRRGFYTPSFPAYPSTRHNPSTGWFFHSLPVWSLPSVITDTLPAACTMYVLRSPCRRWSRVRIRVRRTFLPYLDLVIHSPLALPSSRLSGYHSSSLSPVI